MLPWPTNHAFDLSDPQLYILARIHLGLPWAPLGQSRKEQASSNRSLRRLESRGLLRRDRRTTNGWTSGIILTRAGQDLVGSLFFENWLKRWVESSSKLTGPQPTLEP